MAWDTIRLPDPGFAIGGVEKHGGEVLRGQGAVAELGNFLVQTRADPRHLRFGDPGVSAERFDEVIHFAGRDAVDVGLHHDREQGLVNPAAPLQQRGEERTGAQLRDLQIKISGRGRQRPRADAVAVRGAVAGTFERGGADERGRFRIDQFLIQSFRRDANTVGDIGEFEFSQQVEQGRLV
jgi:hypothetical protein